MDTVKPWDKANSHSFTTLDGLRGVAATAVVLFHCPSLIGMQLVPHGYLAVDFFFMLSGFVLTHAYQRRLENGWSVNIFMRVRIARLYPLYVCALLLGFFAIRLQALHGTRVGSEKTHVTILALGLCLLPYIGKASVALFPFNMPSWSIFFELLANLIHVVFYRKITIGRLAFGVIVGLSGTLIAAQRVGNLDFGPYVSSGWWAFFRVLLAYTIGILLFHYWTNAKRRFKLSPFLCVGMLLVILVVPIHGRAFEFFSVLIAFPLLVFLAAGSQVSGTLMRVLLWLGQASYAV